MGDTCDIPWAHEALLPHLTMGGGGLIPTSPSTNPGPSSPKDSFS